MPIPPSWHLISRGEHASSPESDQSSTAGTTGNVVPSNAFADDLFREKFMGIAKGGSNGEKIMRGFLIGLAIGLVVACFFCCWYPCCRPRLQNRRRRRRTRRGPPATDEEQNSTQETTQNNTQNTTNNAPPA